MDDKEALEYMRHGKEKGLEVLYKRYFGKLRKRVLWLLQKYHWPDEAIADEICNEVFFQFHKTILQFQEKCSVSTWLYKLAKHEVLRRLEKENRRQPEEPLPDWEELPDENEPIYDPIFDDEQVLCYARCITQVFAQVWSGKEADCPIVLILFYMGVSIEEMATTIGKKRQATTRLLERCQKKLKEKPDCLTALMLHHAIGMSYAELAPIVGKPSISAVGYFLSECRKKIIKNNPELKRCWEDCNHD